MARVDEGCYSFCTLNLDHDGPCVAKEMDYGNARAPGDSMAEVRTKSSTGGEKGVKPQRMDLIPPAALLEIAEHFGKGAVKYADHNYRKGYEWSKSFAALQRHLWAFWDGEDTDAETGSHHLAAVGTHAMMLLTLVRDHPQFDDRYKP